MQRQRQEICINMEVSKLRVSISPADCYIPKDVKLVPSSVEWESLGDLIPEYWMPSREAMATICIVFVCDPGIKPMTSYYATFLFSYFICICDDDGFDSINRIKKTVTAPILYSLSSLTRYYIADPSGAASIVHIA